MGPLAGIVGRLGLGSLLSGGGPTIDRSKEPAVSITPDKTNKPKIDSRSSDHRTSLQESKTYDEAIKNLGDQVVRRLDRLNRELKKLLNKPSDQKAPQYSFDSAGKPVVKKDVQTDEETGSKSYVPGIFSKLKGSKAAALLKAHGVKGTSAATSTIKNIGRGMAQPIKTFGKGGVLGPVSGVLSAATEYANSGSKSRAIASGVGTFVGGTAGAVVGAAAGPVGSIGGGIGGAYVGETAALKVHDLVSGLFTKKSGPDVVLEKTLATLPPVIEAQRVNFEAKKIVFKYSNIKGKNAFSDSAFGIPSGARQAAYDAVLGSYDNRVSDLDRQVREAESRGDTQTANRLRRERQNVQNEGNQYSQRYGSKIPMSGDRNANMRATYEGFIEAGLTPEMARAMTAHVGRENDFNGKYMFGNHSDPHNGARNVGIFSWQKGRDKGVLDYLRKHGHLDENGNIKQTPEAIKAQAKYAMEEMKKNYPKVYERVQSGQMSFEEAIGVIGRGYVKWRADDPRYSAAGNRKMSEYGERLKRMQQGEKVEGGALRSPPGEDGTAHPIPGFKRISGVIGDPRGGGTRSHKGTDFAAPGGTKFFARKGGKIVEVNGYGDITVQALDGSRQIYRHVVPDAANGIQKGATVKPGQGLGVLRQYDPRSTGPHLHYEEFDSNGRLLDPSGVLRQRPQDSRGSLGEYLKKKREEEAAKEDKTPPPAPEPEPKPDKKKEEKKDDDKKDVDKSGKIETKAGTGSNEENSGGVVNTKNRFALLLGVSNMEAA